MTSIKQKKTTSSEQLGLNVQDHVARICERDQQAWVVIGDKDGNIVATIDSHLMLEIIQDYMENVFEGQLVFEGTMQ